MSALMSARSVIRFLMSFAFLVASVLGPSSLAAQSVSLDRQTPVLDPAVTFRYGYSQDLAAQIAFMREVLVWLNDQPDTIAFLRAMRFDPAFATTVTDYAEAIANDKETIFFQSDNGMLLLDAFGLHQEMEEFLDGRLSEAGQNMESQLGGSAGGGGDAPNLCTQPDFDGSTENIQQSESDATDAAEFAALKSAGEKFQAGISSGMRDQAGFIGKVVGKAAGTYLGGQILRASLAAPETGAPFAALILTVWLSEMGAEIGETFGKAAYDKGSALYDDIILANAEANYDSAVDRTARWEKEAAAYDRAARAAEGRAEKAQNDADAAQGVADRKKQKANQTGNDSDKQAAAEAQDTADAKKKKAAEAKAEAEEKRKAAEEAERKAEAARKAAAEARKQLEAAKKKKGSTLPGGDMAEILAASPFTDYVRARMLQYHLRILAAFDSKDGLEPTTILVNPFDDTNTSAGTAGRRRTGVAEGLMTPVVRLGGSAEPCIDFKLKMVGGNGLSPTEILIDPTADPTDGPVGPPPDNPLD